MSELVKRVLTGISLLTILIYSILYAPFWIFPALVTLILGIILFTEWPRLFDYKRPFFWLMLPYLLVPFFLISILHLEGYRLLNFLLICMVAAHDTGSYFVGKRWGKYKIVPTISPRKTWEGFIGGCSATFLVAVLFFTFQQLPSFAFLFLFSLTVSTLAFLGDIFESYLKRKAHIKDSGTILPGHGGLLDRIDSMMFVVIFIYFMRKVLWSFLL